MIMKDEMSYLMVLFAAVRSVEEFQRLWTVARVCAGGVSFGVRVLRSCVGKDLEVSQDK